MNSLVLQNLKKKRAVVFGDLMLDHYTHGNVSRISPEAPVPVLHVNKEKILPGGAGNVMVNLVALGLEVYACGRVGTDSAGRSCLDALREKKVNVDGVFFSPRFQTPVKKRMIAQNQQILRVDYEQKLGLEKDEIAACLDFFKKKDLEIDVVIISDYAKGFCEPELLQEIIREAKRKNIPVIVDPKANSFENYRGATLIKPNFGEAAKAAQIYENASIEEIAKKIFTSQVCTYLMITQSEKGIFLFKNGEKKHFPACVHEVKDVTGAGDTVCAVIAFSFAHKISLETGCSLANLAAGYVIERLGCVEISLEQLRQLVEQQRVFV